MLIRQNRLSAETDFKRVYRTRQTVRAQGAVIFFIRNSLSVSRFGFVVGKKFGKAVERNRIKRLFREAVQYNLPQILSGYDVVIQIKSALPDTTLWPIENSILRAFAHARVLKVPYDLSGKARSHISPPAPRRPGAHQTVSEHSAAPRTV